MHSVSKHQALLPEHHSLPQSNFCSAMAYSHQALRRAPTSDVDARGRMSMRVDALGVNVPIIKLNEHRSLAMHVRTNVLDKIGRHLV